jgi:hypothetical protein
MEGERNKRENGLADREKPQDWGAARKIAKRAK